MQYENKDMLSKSIEEYSRYFLEIPSEFDVRHEYLLDGISKNDFAKAFKAYRELIFSIYKDMADKPENYGFISTDKKGNYKNTKQPIECITWLMYALGKAGEVKNRSLIVSSQKLNEIFSGNHDCIIKGVNNSIVDRRGLFQKLIDFGFEFTISDFDKIENDFNVKINTNHNICIAIKAFTLSWYSDESFMCDYAGFNYHVFSAGFTESLPYKHLYIATLASEKTKTYMETVIAELAKLGYKCKNIRYHHFNKNVWMYRCCFFYQVDDMIHMNLPAHYAPKHRKNAYLEHLESMPEKYRKRHHCNGCRKECANRSIEAVDNKKIAYCYPHVHLQNLNELEDIPYLIDLIKVTFQTKSK